jgi:hypothetical protein
VRYTDIKARINEQNRACNRGDAQEVVLACAVYFRLLQNKPITEKQLVSFLTKLPNTTPIQRQQKTKQDVFNLMVEAKQDVIDCVVDVSNYMGGLFTGITQQAINYANSQIDEQVKFIHSNKRKDTVAIDVVGTQGAKIDLSAKVTYKDTQGNEITEPLSKLNLSLKVASKKFGQASGFGMQPFTKLFGIMGFEQEVQPILNKNKNKFTEFEQVRKTDKAKAIELGKPVVASIYSSMTRIMKKAFADERTDEKKEYKLLGNLANAIQREFVGDDDFVDVVEFDDKGYSVLSAQSINALKDAIKSSEIDVRYIEKAVNPSIQVFDRVSKKLIFEVRSTFNKYGYLRNFLDQGPFMSDFKARF